MEDKITPEELIKYFDDMKFSIAGTMDKIKNSYEQFENFDMLLSSLDDMISNIDILIEEV